MNPYLEYDDKRDLYRWQQIADSEDHIILAERGGGYQEGDEPDDSEENPDVHDEYEDIVRYLHRVCPNIRWRIAFDGSDRQRANPSRWRVICIPDKQLREAQYVFDRFGRGDDLSDYCYADRYPEIYERRSDRERVLNSNVSKFHLLLSNFEECLINWSKKGIAEILANLIDILPQVYIYARKLPFVAEAPELGHQGEMSFDRNIALADCDEFFYYPDPYHEQGDTRLLSELLISIYEEIEQGLIAFSTKKPDDVAAAVNHWRVGFSIQDGWGGDLLLALSVLHYAQWRAKDRPGYSQTGKP